MTVIESEIVDLLKANKGKVVTFNTLSESVWGIPFSKMYSNTISVHIHKVRSKRPKLNIRNIKGKGYILR